MQRKVVMTMKDNDKGNTETYSFMVNTTSYNFEFREDLQFLLF